MRQTDQALRTPARGRYRRGVAASLLLALGLPLHAQQGPETLTLDDLVESGRQWLRENADERVVEALEQVDPAQARRWAERFQRQFQGEYVVDFVAVRGAAEALLPLLQRRRETRPYAAWLRARMDYFEVAESLRLVVPPPPAPKPGKPPLPPSNPSPTVQRQVWQKTLEDRPAPRGAQAYVTRLKPVFTAQGLPAAMVWLAEVESAFDPAATSPAGAVGLYQLMPATARSLGLSLSPKDERLDPEKNARAAAKYLAMLLEKFKDWRLTLAAYNAGEGRVQRLLNQHQTRSFDRIATSLPAETQMYVPKVEATLKRRAGVTLERL